MIGTTIANFRIDAKLGEGGMGIVYKAMDLNLDRVVAIKVISADLSRDPGLMERFRAEAKAQAHLNHTNIASLYNLLSVENYNAIVMEFLEGETFDQMLHRRGLVPSAEAVPFFRQALLGIGFAHRNGIVHRDIKPSNIMVNKYGVVKVMDFGIAKVLGGQRLTRTGTQVGTAAYMSPEQIRNRPVDIRSDIYSLGVTLFELLTAHLPFENESEFEVMSDHVNTPPPPPTRYYPYIPRGIEQCVLKALDKNPDARFQTVEEFGSALEHPEGIEQWLAARPALQAPPMLHTGGTPPLSSAVFATAVVGGATFPPTGTPYTPPPSSVTSTPPPQTPIQPEGPSTVVPATTLFLTNKSNRPLLAAAAALLLAGLLFGGYQLFKPKPAVVPFSAAENTGSGGSVRAIASPNLLSSVKAPDTLLSSGGSPTGAPAAQVGVPPPTTPRNDDASTQALQNARKALSGGRLFDPRSNSAFYWAKQAEINGNPGAANVQQKILSAAMQQVQTYKDTKNFAAATTLTSEMVQCYPNRREVLQLSASIQTDERAYQQKQAEQQQQQALKGQADRQEELRLQVQQQLRKTTQQLMAARTFVVTHRHAGFNQLNPQLASLFCTGTLTIAADGIVRYNCLQTRDQHCEHATVIGSDVMNARVVQGGELHMVTKTLGNWDFSGEPQQIIGASQALNHVISSQR